MIRRNMVPQGSHACNHSDATTALRLTPVPAMHAAVLSQYAGRL